MEDMSHELARLKQDIRDLKTAQLKPSIMKFYSKTFTIPNNITKGIHHWTIHYGDTNNTTPPITYRLEFIDVLEFYDADTNTQKIVMNIPSDGTYGGDEITYISTREITSITQDS